MTDTKTMQLIGEIAENVSEKRSRRVSVPQKPAQSVLTLTNEMLEEEHKIPIPKFVEDKTYTDKGGAE